MERGINRILNIAAVQGFECEVYGEEMRRLQVEVYRGEIESVSRSSDAGIGIRLVRDARVGHACTSDLTSWALDDAFREAKENVSASSPMEVDVLADYHDIETGERGCRKLPSEDSMAMKVYGVRNMEQACLDFDPAVVNIEGAGYYEVSGEIMVASTRGFFRREKRGLCSCSLSAVAQRNGEVRSGWYYDQALDPRNIDFSGVGREAARRAVGLLGSERIATRRYSIILDGAAFTDIIGLFERALSAEMVVKGTSVLAGKLKTPVAPEIFTLVDDPFMEGGCFNSSFDAEGVPTRRCILVESGILKGFLHDTYSARKMDVSSTANAVRASFKSFPAPGPTNFYLLPGDRGTEEMVKDLEEGIFVQDIMGMHTADPISGDFSVGIEGHYIHAGTVTASIGEMTMSGNILDLLQAIVEVGRDMVFIGQYGSPPVLVEELSVSGT
ncbi:MAG: TldD/PmbA family protein [Candidatus Krumholzibacteria bacterium]|nr:TldD/PmbA family protein [Candidatus Krumholzibacteria bacterium]